MPKILITNADKAATAASVPRRIRPQTSISQETCASIENSRPSSRSIHNLRKLAFTLRFGEIKILLSDDKEPKDFTAPSADAIREPALDNATEAGLTI